MIEIKNLSKTFRQKKTTLKALDKINLKINPRDIIGVIGFSGAGKSTLIRSINLLEKPDQGEILIKGKDLTQLNHRDLAQERKKIGMIFQHFNLLSSRTVFENIALPLELDRRSQAEIHQKVNTLLEVVGLEDKRTSYPKSLSGGQKQRVAIARALANDPYVLLCDEATSALDPTTTLSILQLLKDINRRLGVTILLITHEMEVIKAICNRVAVIDKGHLIAKGAWEDILTKKKHSIINQFMASGNLSLPQSLSKKLEEKYREGLAPLIELELHGEKNFDQLLSQFYVEEGTPSKIVKAELENLSGVTFGKLVFHLQGNKAQNESALQFFNTNKIKNNIRGYV